MWDLTIEYNGTAYPVTYNEQSGYYEIELTAPATGGIYPIDITYDDFWEEEYTATYDLQVFAKKPIEFDIPKVFMWIFDYRTAIGLVTKDIVEIADYEITIDEETNAKSTIKVLKETTAKAKDIIAVKKNNEVVYWGMIDEIQNEDGKNSFTYVTKYFTNIFDRKIKLTNESTIRTTGIEDFLVNTMRDYFISILGDSKASIHFLSTAVTTHTPKQISVTNVENQIYNFHTWLTNCNQMYSIMVKPSVIKSSNRYYLRLTIGIESLNTELVDTNAQNISNYTEVFETDVMAKVIVLYDKVDGQEQSGTYTLYLKTDRTTTTNSNDPDRAEGNITTVYTENYEDANQTALDVMKGNEYNHNITFNYDKYIPQGTPIAIKTKNQIIYNTYISSVKITQNKFYEYICGNIRINFIDKLKKEIKNA